MAVFNVLVANDVTIPEGLVEQFNKLGGADESGHTWQDMIADLGQLRNMENLTMALAVLYPFKNIMETAKKQGATIDVEQLQDVLFGIAMSYALGLGEWEPGIPVYFPNLEPKLLQYDRVRLRSGKEYTVLEFMDKLTEIVDSLPMEDVLDKMYPKPLMGKRGKLDKPHAGLFALAQVFQGVDTL